jgi:hypothetical protein
MSNSKKLGNKRNQQMRMQCIDYATRTVGKPAYITEKDGKVERRQDDVIEVATKIYEFVKGS